MTISPYQLKFVLIVLVMCGANVHASYNKTVPLQLSVWPDALVFPGDSDVYGLRLCLPYGRDTKVTGVDIGIMNGSMEMHGIQLGVLNVSGTVFNTYSTVGIQVAGLGNVVLDGINGIQLASLLNVTEGVRGMQLAAISNIAIHDMMGVQVGIINYAQNAHGFQFGIINYCDSMSGVQVGLANIIKNSPVPILPIVNARF